MTYTDIANNVKNIEPFCIFKLIETVTVYNEGQMFDEYTRFYGSEVFVSGIENDYIKTSNKIDDALAFTSDEEATEFIIKLASIMKDECNKSYDGIQVIEYNELHSRSSEVLHYPNRYYSHNNNIQPVSIYHSRETREKAYNKMSLYLKDELMNEIQFYYRYTNNVEISDETVDYLYSLSVNRLQRILMNNRGRKKFEIKIKNIYVQ